MFSNRRYKLAILAAAALMLLLVGTAAAVLNHSFPSFQVQNLDGSSANSSAWTMSGDWAVIYVEGQCGPCTHLLASLRKDKYPNLAAKTIIIVGGAQASDVQALQATFPDLAAATWYADPSRNAVSALNLHGMPVTLGVEDNTIAWSVGGIPPTPNLLFGVLKKWSSH